MKTGGVPTGVNRCLLRNKRGFNPPLRQVLASIEVNGILFSARQVNALLVLSSCYLDCRRFQPFARLRSTRVIVGSVPSIALVRAPIESRREGFGSGAERCFRAAASENSCSGSSRHWARRSAVCSDNDPPDGDSCKTSDRIAECCLVTSVLGTLTGIAGICKINAA